MKNDDDLLHTRDVADWLKVAEATLRKWRSHGTGPKYIKVGYAVRYRRGDVREWSGGNTRGGR